MENNYNNRNPQQKYPLTPWKPSERGIVPIRLKNRTEGKQTSFPEGSDIVYLRAAISLIDHANEQIQSADRRLSDDALFKFVQKQIERFDLHFQQEAKERTLGKHILDDDIRFKRIRKRLLYERADENAQIDIELTQQYRPTTAASVNTDEDFALRNKRINEHLKKSKDDTISMDATAEFQDIFPDDFNRYLRFGMNFAFMEDTDTGKFALVPDMANDYAFLLIEQQMSRIIANAGGMPKIRNELWNNFLKENPEKAYLYGRDGMHPILSQFFS